MKTKLLMATTALILGSQIVAPHTTQPQSKSGHANNTIVNAQTQINPTLSQSVTLLSPTPTPTTTPTPTAETVLAKSEDDSPVDIVALGQSMASSYGWTGYLWDDLYALWQRESGWNPNSYNVSSGACGIPQALPCSKIPDHTTKGQISWGLSYISDRYGNPANALYHENTYGWY